IGAELRGAARPIGVGAKTRRAARPIGVAALFALPAVALYGIYGVYALPWIVPLAVLALLLGRPGLRAALAGVGTFLIGVAVLVPDSIHYYNHGHGTITRGTDLGPLGGPLDPLQAAGIWLTGDYRFTPATHARLTYVLAGGVLVAALAGLALAVVRRNVALLLLALPALVAYLITSPSASPYID